MKSLRNFFRILGDLYTRKSQSKFTEWVKEFVLDMVNFDRAGFFEEDFEDWGYSANPAIDGEKYLAFFLACWPNGRVFADPITSVWLETFLTSVKISPRK